MKYVVLLVVFLSSAVQAEDANDCMQIENARERLICFDRLFPTSDRPALPKPRTEPRDSRVPDGLPTVESVLKSTEQVSSEPESEAAKSTPLSKGGMFAKDPKVNLTTTIKAVQRRDQQKMVFLLENGEVWIQDSPRALPIREGDSVTIKNGRVGGYMLSTAGGTTTRVRRIK